MGGELWADVSPGGIAWKSVLLLIIFNTVKIKKINEIDRIKAKFSIDCSEEWFKRKNYAVIIYWVILSLKQYYIIKKKILIRKYSH